MTGKTGKAAKLKARAAQRKVETTEVFTKVAFEKRRLVTTSNLNRKARIVLQR
jgi:hypothetical protein